MFAVLTTVFVFTFLAAAQTGGTSGSTGTGGQQGTPDQTTKKAAHKGGAAGATLTGCLSGPNEEGAYELKRGKRTVEVGGLDDLSKHVGHEVKLHGSWAKSGSEIGEKEEKGESAEKGGGTKKGEGAEEKGERHFKVTSIDHVSDTCKAGAGMKGEAGEHHHMKGSSSTGTGQASPSPTPKL
jgi:hypothetical protein